MVAREGWDGGNTPLHCGLVGCCLTVVHGWLSSPRQGPSNRRCEGVDGRRISTSTRGPFFVRSEISGGCSGMVGLACLPLYILSSCVLFFGFGDFIDARALLLLFLGRPHSLRRGNAPAVGVASSAAWRRWKFPVRYDSYLAFGDTVACSRRKWRRMTLVRVLRRLRRRRAMPRRTPSGLETETDPLCTG